jgi:hypothetical protein
MPTYRTGVEATATIDAERVCTSCGARTRAIVEAVGHAATGPHGYAGADVGTIGAARSAATRGIAPDARDSLGMARCPKCGRRDVRSIVGFALTRGIGAAIFFGLIGVCIGFGVSLAAGIGVDEYDHVHFDAMGPMLSGSTLVVAALGVVGVVVARVRRADRSVRFDGS